jgi:hypothetical protein
MTSLYAPEEIDPETLHLSVDVPFMEHLAGLIYQARWRARTQHKVVLVHHDVEMVPAAVEGGSPTTRQVIGYVDREPDLFAKATLQCPRAADAEWEAQHQRPRPFPSILVNPQGQVAVSKPGLCAQCVFGLSRQVTGHCDRRQFTPLPEVVS